MPYQRLNMRSRKYLPHGMTDTPTHQSWRALRDRCKAKSGKNVEYYFARGISYDPRWEVFVDFLEDMGERPEGTTIDRIDGTKGYYKENCRWASAKTQVDNRRSWSTSGEKYISKRKYGYRVKITGKINKNVKTLEEAILLRNSLQEIKYGKES
jgi:hypothetical protein